MPREIHPFFLSLKSWLHFYLLIYRWWGAHAMVCIWRSEDSVVVSTLLLLCGSWVSNVEGLVWNDSTCGAVLPTLSLSFSLNSWVIVSPSLTDSQSQGFWAILLIWLQRSIACITNCQEGKNQALGAFFQTPNYKVTYLLSVTGTPPCFARWHRH